MPGGLSFEYPRHDDHDQYDDYNYNKDSRIDTSAEDIANQFTTGHRKKQEEEAKESDKVFHSVNRFTFTAKNHANHFDKKKAATKYTPIT